jgi:hypothetical protein
VLQLKTPRKTLALLFLCLLAPSIWMMAAVPPLWRDSDGYHQLIEDPRLTTFWGFGPAYGYLAKIPVFLVGLVEHWVTGAPMFPALSDASIGALIFTQHLALALAACAFVCAVAQVFWVRLGVALAWASNPVFYTFAHSVGSESMSVIVVILFVTQSLRVMRARHESSWRQWLLFGIALLGCLLSRQINGLLIFLLPAASLLEWVSLRMAQSYGRGASSAVLRRLVLSLAIGIPTVVTNSALIQDLARKTKLRPHSRFGATFVWRLGFLTTMTPPDRQALLRAAANHAGSHDARRLLDLVELTCNDGSFTTAAFTERALILFPAEGPAGPWVRYDRAFNQMAFAFLLPPKRELIEAATTDFAAAAAMPVSDVSDYLFATTAYYFEHQDEMSRCAGLATFRYWDAETLKRLPRHFPYFHLWRGLNYHGGLLLWALGLAAFVVVAWRKNANVAGVAGFAIALVAVGAITVAANCLLTELLPRYGLPMWQLLLLSFFLLLANTAELLITPRGGEVRRAADRSEP